MDSRNHPVDLIPTSSGATLKDIGKLAKDFQTTPQNIFTILQILGSAKLSYSIDEAAKATGTGVTTIRAAISAGEIEVAHVGAKKSKPVIPAPALASWINSSRAAA
jgi:excisionase family DNA binding protein